MDRFLRELSYIMAFQMVFSLPGKSLSYEMITRENVIYKDDNYPQVHSTTVFPFMKVISEEMFIFLHSCSTVFFFFY